METTPKGINQLIAEIEILSSMSIWQYLEIGGI